MHPLSSTYLAPGLSYVELTMKSHRSVQVFPSFAYIVHTFPDLALACVQNHPCFRLMLFAIVKRLCFDCGKLLNFAIVSSTKREVNSKRVYARQLVAGGTRRN